MERRAWLMLVGLVLSGVAFGGQADARRPKPTACAGGRFLVEGERLAGGGTVPADAVTIAGTQVSTASGCAPVEARVKATRKKTLVRASWASCSGIEGRVSLQAQLSAADCTTMRGRFKARRAKLKRAFVARLQTAPSFTTGAFAPAPLSTTQVGPGGGTVAVSDATHPLYGLEIVVPPGATTETITFSVEYADITGASGLPAGASTASKLVRVTASGSPDWNLYRMFTRPVRVTLPYTAPAEGEESVRFYVQKADGTLEPAGLEALDTANDRLTFFTSVFGDVAEPSRLGLAAMRATAAEQIFATFVAIGLSAEALATLTGSFVVDTGFLPSRNGWYIPNYGSYYKKSRGGSCFGFVGAAKYYFARRHSPLLFENYRDANRTPTWVDDAVAIQFTSRVHNAMADIWDEYVTGEVNLQTPSSRAVALSFVGGLYVTGVPVLLYIQQALRQADGTLAYSGAHAIAVYRADVGPTSTTFSVYDPNFPGADDRRIVYSRETGFASYLSGTDASSSAFHYNYFKHVGFHVGLSDAALDAIKVAADRGFADDSVFPVVLITAVEGGRSGEAAAEGTTARGEHKYIVNDNSVRIRGTILGGLAQDACCVVDNARVLLSSDRFSVPVDNQPGGGTGEFEALIPIGQGENEIVILAARQNSFSHWAAFHRDVIESTYSPAAMTVTLTWDQDRSDIDLYVREPAGPGVEGDTVYYGHRKGVSDMYPYLDFDNTRGFGPEHYIALNGMRTLYAGGSEAPSLYGDYTVKVHYYADHDDDPESVQPISWNVRWRFLAFCPDPCDDPEEDGFWEEGSSNGVLTAAASGNCCNIEHSGADWSAPIAISYPQPDPEDWIVPSPSEVMLP